MDSLSSDPLCLQDLVASATATGLANRTNSPSTQSNLPMVTTSDHQSPLVLSDTSFNITSQITSSHPHSHPHPYHPHHSHQFSMQPSLHPSVSVNSSQVHARSLTAQSVPYPPPRHVSSLFPAISTPPTSISSTPSHHHFYNHHHPSHFQPSSTSSLNNHNSSATSKYSPHLDTGSPSVCHHSVSSCSSSVDDCKKSNTKSGKIFTAAGVNRL